MVVMIALGTVLQEQDIQGEMKSSEPNEKPIHSLSHKPSASLTKWPTIEKKKVFLLSVMLYRN